MNTSYVSFDLSQMRQFRKKDLIRYVISSLDIAPEGSEISVPTLEGKVTIVAGEGTLVMIGPCQDPYPVTAKLFAQQYRIVSGSAENVADLARHLGWNPELLRPCRLKAPSVIYAKAVDREFQVFVREHNTVLYGKAGDYYAVNVDRPDRPYIIQADILVQTYEAVDHTA